MQLTYAQAMKVAATKYLRKTLKRAGGKDAAARMAGCNRTHFYRLLARHGIETPKAKRGNWGDDLPCRAGS